MLDECIMYVTCMYNVCCSIVNILYLLCFQKFMMYVCMNNVHFKLHIDASISDYMMIGEVIAIVF